MARSETAILAGKCLLLGNCLHDLGKVGIAYSGGVDSTLLLYLAVQTLGPENVLPLHAVSSLTGSRQRARAEAFFHAVFNGRLQLRTIAVDPLSLSDVAANTPLRCYHCKKAMYQRLLEELPDRTNWRLADGTNVDDTTDDRPGMMALAELQVATPLLSAGITKSEVRRLARKAGLPNHAEPSESCLATRIATGSKIAPEMLEKIEKAEAFLEAQGYTGTRFRISDGHVHLEIRELDMARFTRQASREKVQQYATDLGFKNVFVKITGR